MLKLFRRIFRTLRRNELPVVPGCLFMTFVCLCGDDFCLFMFKVDSLWFKLAPLLIASRALWHRFCDVSSFAVAANENVS